MLRKHSNGNDPADWFFLGADRLEAADVLWNAEGLTAAGIELLQESVERYRKGYLIAKGWALVKTHDLVPLIGEAAQFDNRFSAFHAFAPELTEDFFAQHYPGEDWQTVGQNHPVLRKQAGELVELIKQSLTAYFPQSGH
jgi:HEPN domain-containing protein